MKKIADMTNGNVLIEMTTKEWEHLQEKPNATIYEVKWNTLEEWQGEFLDGLKKLTLSTRVHNAIERAAQIRTTKYEKIDSKNTEVQTDPYLRDKWTFQTRDSQLLGFEQWCDYTLAHPRDFFVNNIGDKGKNELLQAIRKYKNAN